MDWPMSRTVERQASRLEEMMRAVGANPVDLVRLRAGTAYTEARTKCLECSQARECLLWLDANPPSCEAPLFCPNLNVFQVCKKAE